MPVLAQRRRPQLATITLERPPALLFNTIHSLASLKPSTGLFAHAPVPSRIIMNTPDLEKTAFIDLADPAPLLPVAVVNSELHSLLLLANILSVGWSYFCLHSSTNRRSFAYEFMHEEAAWVS